MPTQSTLQNKEIITTPGLPADCEARDLKLAGEVLQVLDSEVGTTFNGDIL
jgi:hypothetical protein